MGINKVQYGNTTLIDLTADTVTADKLMQGYTAHDRSGALITGTATGGTSAISVVDTADSHGGTVRTITALDISDTTAVASDVASGKYFYTADGTKTAGSATQPTLTTKNITANGTYNASSDNADGYSSVTVNVSGGGGDTWSWMGKNPTKVSTLVSEKVYLKDTGYATWTPSTTSTAIVSSRNLNSITLSSQDYNSYAYVVFLQIHTHYEYDPNAEQKAMATDYYNCRTIWLYGFANTLSNMVNGTSNLLRGNMTSSNYCIFYKNDSGVDSYLDGTEQGVYVSSWPNASVTMSHGDASVTLKTAALSARCNSTVFSTDSASAVNQNTSYYEQVLTLWKVDKNTDCIGAQNNSLREMWLDGDIS